MPLESSITYPGDLNALWPLAADPKSDGDDHVRNLKKAVLNGFAGFSGAIAVTGTDGGGPNAYTVAPTVPLPSYGLRMNVIFSPVSANTGACTLNVSGLGAKPLRSVSGVELVLNDLVVGNVYAAFYNGSEFRLLSVTKQYVDQLAFGTVLPAQAGNIGKSIFTDGQTAYWAFAQNMPRLARTANAQLVQADRGSFIDITAGTFTQTFDTPANRGSGWYVLLRNSGTGDITIPAADGVTNWLMYPGEVRIFQCDGASDRSIIVQAFTKIFTASANFIRPPGYTQFGGLAWSGGQSGGRSGAAATATNGGHGGGGFPFTIAASMLAASEVITIGAGGAAVTGVSTTGNSGGNTSFGSLFTVFGADSTGGGAVGLSGPFRTASASAQGTAAAAGFAGGDNQNAVSTLWGGASAAVGGFASGTSLYGGAAGAGITSGGAVATAGVSLFAGNGGAASIAGNGSPGIAPAGGGGATQTGSSSGAGARGEMRVWGII